MAATISTEQGAEWPHEICAPGRSTSLQETTQTGKL